MVTWEVEAKRTHVEHPASSACPNDRLLFPVSLRCQVLQWGPPGFSP